eukprot:scaffold65234_cov22-Tisochrysis_lutea.AAC.1
MGSPAPHLLHEGSLILEHAATTSEAAAGAAAQAAVSPRGDLCAFLDPGNRQSVWVLPLLSVRAGTEHGTATSTTGASLTASMPQQMQRFNSNVVLDKRGTVGPEQFTCMAWSADESRLLLAGQTGALYLLDRCVWKIAIAKVDCCAQPGLPASVLSESKHSLKLSCSCHAS